MATQAVLFDPPRGVLLVPASASGDLDGWSSSVAAQLPVDVSADERDRVLAPIATDAAETGATIVLIWEEGFAPFSLWIQLTAITGIRIAQEFVRSSTDRWIGRLRAPHVGPGLEWFSVASDRTSAPGWSAAYADDDLFVHLTLIAPSFAQLVTRRSLVETSVLPSLVITADAALWRSDEEFPTGVAAPKESWPQLTSAGAPS